MASRPKSSSPPISGKFRSRSSRSNSRLRASARVGSSTLITVESLRSLIEARRVPADGRLPVAEAMNSSICTPLD